MAIRSSLLRLVPVALEPGCLAAALSWPLFSATSFLNVSRLRRQGVIPKTVIDVGANRGQFAVACAKLFPGAQVFSYEPLPSAFSQLQKVAASLPAIHPAQLALGQKPGSASLFENSHSHSSSLLRLAKAHVDAFPHATELNTINVALSTLDIEFAKKTLPSPVLLKLDVQGAEAQVLCGGRTFLSRVDFVLLETSFQPLYQGEPVFRDILALLESLSFHLVRPIDSLLHPQTQAVLQMDLLFSRTAPA